MAMSVVYTNFCGMLVSETRGGTETQYISDPLGSLAGELDTSQNIIHSADYWPYGEVQAETGTNSSNWNFVGLLGYLQDQTSLLYVRARHYLTQNARWLTVDPLWPYEIAYGYVRGKANTTVDPSGLQEKSLGEQLGLVPPGDQPCEQAFVTQLGLRCAGAGDCVDNTGEYGDRFISTGNKLDRCASCVSSAICLVIAGGTIGSLGGGLGGLVGDAVKECLKCQNNCMIDKWRKRTSALWRNADRICRISGESSSACCIASVIAEQGGYDDCAPTCCKPLSLIPKSLRVDLATRVLNCCG